jgi:hypothetical protein
MSDQLMSNTIRRQVRVGGFSKETLLEEFERKGIVLNEAATALFQDTRFSVSLTVRVFDTVETSVLDLGFENGATLEQISQRASDVELGPCALEMGPALRLQFMDQAEGLVGHPPSKNQAPPGAITVVSTPLDASYDTPKGFYLRRMEGVLWLRGYRADLTHVWNPEDRLLFVKTPPCKFVK